MARPQAEINEQYVAAMAYSGASDREIGDMLEVDHKTIANRFSPLLRKQRAARRLKLRQLQWKAAEKGNAALLIFLGKQELDQKDQIELTVEDLALCTDEQLRAIVEGRPVGRLMSGERNERGRSGRVRK